MFEIHLERISELPTKKITIKLFTVKIVFWSGNRFWLNWFLQVVIVYLSSTILKPNNNFSILISVQMAKFYLGKTNKKRCFGQNHCFDNSNIIKVDS